MISDNAAVAYQFLQCLYGDNAPGWLTIWTLPDRATRWFPAQKLEDAATHAINLAEMHDVYFGVGLRKHQRTNGRGAVKDVLGIPGLWMDFDIQHHVHQARRIPPSIDAVLSLIAEIPL
jgi:hypothetical protein